MGMNTSVSFSRQIEVKKEVDIFIAGGGPSGFAAAVTAARQGKKVFLAEGTGCFGGLGTSGLVPCYMTFTDGVNFVSDGIGREIYEELGRQRNAKDPTTDHNAIQPELLKRIYDQKAIEAGVDFVFFTNLIGVIKSDDDRVDMAVLSSKNGIYAVKAKYFIDATGDGDLSVMSGAEAKLGDENGQVMPSSVCTLWAGLDWPNLDRSKQAANLEQAFADHVFTIEDRHLTGLSHCGTTYGGGNIGHSFDIIGTDAESLTRAMLEQRERLPEFEYYYRHYIPGCENAEIVATAPMVGIRESRRVECDYILDIEDFIARRTFDDDIGRNCYSVDIHPKSGSREGMSQFEKERKTYRLKQGESHGIPYRSLIVKGFKNLLVAGRCIGASQIMQSAIRTMPTCYVMGQAAGMALSCALENSLSDVRDVDIHELQQRLSDMGAYLPGFKK